MKTKWLNCRVVLESICNIQSFGGGWRPSIELRGQQSSLASSALVIKRALVFVIFDLVLSCGVIVVSPFVGASVKKVIVKISRRWTPINRSQWADLGVDPSSRLKLLICTFQVWSNHFLYRQMELNNNNNNNIRLLNC